MTPQLPRYKHYDLGRQPIGTVVEVALSSINNVRLLDEPNYKLYAGGKAYKFIGGLTVKTPTKLTVPSSGHWHLVVDREGLPKLANSNVRTIRPGHTQASVQREEGADASVSEPTASFAVNAAETAIAIDAGKHSPQVMAEILKALNEYKQIANTDALTGLPNRRAFDERLAALFAADAREEAALVIADVDHFKSFNDTYGHLVGDKVLVTVAGALRAALAPSVFVARAGGEEFAFVVSGADAADAFPIAEKARQAVAATAFVASDGKTDYGRITISMGICRRRDANNAADLYEKADNALYRSKKDGRNRCTVFIPEVKATA